MLQDRAKDAGSSLLERGSCVAPLQSRLVRVLSLHLHAPGACRATPLNPRTRLHSPRTAGPLQQGRSIQHQSFPGSPLIVIVIEGQLEHKVSLSGQLLRSQTPPTPNQARTGRRWETGQEAKRATVLCEAPKQLSRAWHVVGRRSPKICQRT